MACAIDAAPSARDLCKSGPAISMYVWDRGCFSCLNRMVRQRHASKKLENVGPTAPLRNLLDFVFTRGDCLHDGHNSFLWGLKPYLGDDVSRDMYVGIAAVRNSYNILMENAMRWLPTVLDVTEDCVAPGLLRQLWVSLGLDEELVEHLVEYRLIWINGKLKVNKHKANGHGWIDEVVAMQMAVWRFVTFSDGRMITVGPASRALVASCLTGIDSLQNFCRKQMDCSEYHIHGWDRLKPEVWAVIAVTALASGVSETAVKMLMDDDRVMMSGWPIHEALGAELEYVNAMSPKILELICQALPWSYHLTPCELHSRVLHVSYISSAFLDKKVFKETEHYPWKLARGNITNNLRSLKQDSKPQGDETTEQIWELLNLDFPEAVLVETVEQVQKLPWSSIGVEQAHASAAQVKKHHPEMMENMLTCRSFLSQFRPLISRAMDVEEVGRYQKEINRIMEQNPACQTGRQLFLKEAFSQAAEMNPARMRFTVHDCHAIMASHAEQYFALEPAVRAGYEQRAAHLAEDKAIVLRETIQDLEVRQDLVRLRQAEAKTKSNTWRLDACRLGSDQMQAFQNLFDSKSRSEVEQDRVAALVPPEQPEFSERLGTSAIPIPSRKKWPLPKWLDTICNHREHFHHCAVLHKEPSDDDDDWIQHWWMVMLAIQNPKDVCLAALDKREFGAHVMLSSGGIHGPADLLGHWDHDFDFVSHEFYHTEHNPCGWHHYKEKWLYVLPGVSFLPGSRAVSHLDVVPWQEFIAALPGLKKQTREQPATQPVARDTKAAMMAENPWAMQYMEEGRQVLRNQRQKVHPLGAPDDEVDGEDGEWEEEAPASLDADAIGEVYNAMEQARNRVTHDHTGAFRVVPLGGKWLMATSGMAQDAWKGMACLADSKNWCQAYGLNISARFNINAYQNEGAMCLARLYVARLSHFYEIWIDLGCPKPYTFSQEQDEAFIEPESFTDFRHTVLPQLPQFYASRVLEISALRPLGSGQ